MLRHDGQWFVEDMGSTNGTHLGTQKVTGPPRWQDRRPIRLGKTVLELRK